MPREVPAVPHTWKKPPPAERHSYDIELITPIFGSIGGVSTRVNDSNFPIRPTAIRGQLQFWWRATVGAHCATLPELRAAQSAAWGSTSHASQVQVRVEMPEEDVPASYARFERYHKNKNCYLSTIDGRPAKNGDC